MYQMKKTPDEYRMKPAQERQSAIADEVMRIAFTPYLSRQVGVPVHGHLTEDHLGKIYRMALKR